MLLTIHTTELACSFPLFWTLPASTFQTELMHMCDRLFPVYHVAKTDRVLSVPQHCPIMDSDRTSNMPSVPRLRMYSTHPWVHAMKTLPWWAAIQLSLDSKASEDMSEG